MRLIEYNNIAKLLLYLKTKDVYKKPLFHPQALIVWWMRNVQQKTLQSIGDLLGMTRERIRQIDNRTWEVIQYLCKKYKINEHFYQKTEIIVDDRIEYTNSLERNEQWVKHIG